MKFINSLLEKYSQYLPSKNFRQIMGVALVVLVLIFLILFIFSKKENFGDDNSSASNLNIENQSISDLVVRDSDNDGVPDWEEALWGTDKNKVATFEGIRDDVYIAGKKNSLKTEQEEVQQQENLTETDKFARQFFASFVALKSSGQGDANTVESFSNVLGQEIVDPVLIDRYSARDVTLTLVDDANEQLKYYETIQGIFETYEAQGIGDELELISGGLSDYSTTGEVSDYVELTAIADAYASFAKEAIEIPVPESFAVYHLQIANSASNTGISVSNMTKIIVDPIVGLSGVSQYQKYSEELIEAVSNLESSLPE